MVLGHICADETQGAAVSDLQPFRAESVLSTLTGFQRNTVEHVIERFYGPDPTDRFLVADETGLGKTMVARGVIARTIEELQHNEAVDRVDIVYVCSNQDLAQQNLRKLNVSGDDHHGIASRLTLLAKHAGSFSPPGGGRLIKAVNLVSFTPGTSFSKGWASGTAEERAMIFLLLEEPLRLVGPRARAAYSVLQGSLRTPERLESYIGWLRWELPTIPTAISDAFLAAAGEGTPSLLNEFEYLVENIDTIQEPWRRTWPLVGKLRAVLARESVRLLTPDLVILDEFQRFRELMDPASEAGELAHHLFQYRDPDTDHRAKVLLLSATPFKPFTYAEERALGDDHHRDFLEVVKFLANGEESETTQRVTAALRDYRQAVVTGTEAAALTADVRAALHKVMTRTERPRHVYAEMSKEELTRLEMPPEDDLLGFVALKELARSVQAPLSIEYWKSAPYFVNFMDGYKIAEKVQTAVRDPLRERTVLDLLRRCQRLDFEAVAAYQPINMGNARMRALAASTIDAGWWKLLWLPPSLPYLAPGGQYAEEFAQSVTKRLIFSSWTATPTAVASLLSYEADRLSVPDDLLEITPQERTRERRTRRGRLAFRIDREGDRDRPSAMSTLAIFWPMPGLAALADPRAAELHQGTGGAGRLESDHLESLVTQRLRSEHLADLGRGLPGPTASHWYEAFRRLDSRPGDLGEDQAVAALSGASNASDHPKGADDLEAGEEPAEQSNMLARHVQQAFKTRGAGQDRNATDQALGAMAGVAAHSPGNIAYRALGRLRATDSAVSELGLWLAAARLSSAFRTLFSRPETVFLLDKLNADPEPPYWGKVLRYCADGNLQAVMDEYIYHLHVSQGAPAVDDSALMQLAEMAATALELRGATYEVFDPDAPFTPQKFSPRFALRFGGRREAQESNRQPIVRQAFNSPFWPFVLATTSVGQEGVDFHWWCHSVMHWNTPASPIDFEQREGRVDRYDGHAVRRNIAQRHGAAILASEEANPWQVAYELAEDEQESLDEFAPHWVYPGDAHIQRHVSPFPLSIDEARLDDIKRDVALYRLTFGQPRQEDMLELLRRHYSDATPEQLDALRLDLSAPDRHDTANPEDDL
jgi:hypothetical protein